MEFIDLVSSVRDFVLKSHHMRHELLDNALDELESRAGDCGLIFVQLHRKQANIEDLLSFLKSIRDVPTGPVHFSNSKSFSEAFGICDKALELQHVFLEILNGVPVACLCKEACGQVALKVAQWVCQEDASVSETAGSVLERICVVDADLGLGAMMKCAEHVRDNSTLLLRYASVVGQILSSRLVAASGNGCGGGIGSNGAVAGPSSNRDALFAACLAHGAVQLIVSLSISCQDLLLQMLGVELLSSFAGSASGICFLFEQGHFSWMVDQAAGVLSGDPNVDPIIAVSCLMEVSNLFLKCMQTDTVQVLLPLLARNSTTGADYMDTLSRCVAFHLDSENRSDEAGHAAALSACAAMCSLSPAWLHAIVTNKLLTQDWIGLINGGSDTQAALLVSLATILTYHEARFPSDGSNSSTNCSSSSNGTNMSAQHVRDLGLLVEAIGAQRAGSISTVGYLVKIASQPIDTLAVASLRLMTAMAAQNSGWGVNMLFSSTRFFPFLTDRSTSSSKAQMEAKHEVLVAISKNSRYAHLSSEVVAVLNRHIQVGAFAPAHHAQLAELITL